MKQNPYFILKELAGVPYLLPYGQMIADHRRGMKINVTGAYFWNLLSEEHTMEEILSIAQKHFEIPDAELPSFHHDIKQFINRLIAYGIIDDEFAKDTASGANTEYINIAGLTLKLVGLHDIFPAELNSFVTKNPSEVNQTIEFHIGYPFSYANGTILLRNRELTVMELKNQYIITFPDTPQLFEMHIDKDGSHVLFYCIPPFSAEFKESLFHAIRLGFLYLAQKYNMAALHSASILYKGKAWLFSGPSGTGKSTHTNLWNELWNTPIINGDLNLIAMKNDRPVVYGIPWCGTSGIFSTKTYPLGGIILLRQALHDVVKELTADEKLLTVNLRLISPSWNEELFDINLHTVERIVQKILVCRLACTKEYSAAHTMQKKIDEYLKDAF